MNTISQFLSFQTLAIAVGILLGIVVLIKSAKSLQAQKMDSQPGSAIKARKVLAASRQPMYQRLCEAFPDHIILTEVALSALLETRLQTTRSKFEREVAGFVVCTRTFDVIGIVELDDSADHRGSAQDAARDRMLAEAGYEVLRYNALPTAQSVRDRLVPAMTAG